jgi:Do/DeqQ family serine protease
MIASRTLFAVVLAVGFATTAHAAPAGIPTDGTIADVAERVVDSVVTISSSADDKTPQGDGDPFWGSPFQSYPHTGKTVAKGSGVIVTAGGRILTNSHVVNGFDDIKVTLPDGTELDAKVVGKDPKADVAVIQLQGKVPALKPITFGDSSTLRLGEIVLAIGDGLGVGKSVSMGIVSAKGRGGMGIEEYEDFIQTDAAINHGNSGGALVNLKGELVGINTAIASRTGEYSGIGFAIPTNMVRPIMDMLVRDGKVVRGFLGINITTVTPGLAKERKLGTTTGVYVADVQPKGPAANAGLKADDVITAINGTTMKSGDVLRNTIALTRPGTTVALEVTHPDRSTTTLKAKLGELPEQVADDNDQPQVQQLGPGQWQWTVPQPPQRKSRRHP